MGDAPENIWVRIYEHEKNGFTGLPKLENCWSNYKNVTEYIRADIAEARIRELEGALTEIWIINDAAWSLRQESDGLRKAGEIARAALEESE